MSEQLPEHIYTDAELAHRFPRPVPRSLVVDGLACLECGVMDEAKMMPVARGPRGQLFAHAAACPTHARLGGGRRS